MRFSLKAILLLVTFLAVFLGYSQCRRQNILRQVKEIEQLGGQVTLPNELRDYLWQRYPTKGQKTIGPWADTENLRRARESESRMKTMGITEITTRNLY